MLKKFRQFFLVVSALGYGFLGGGPSLWALDLAPQDPVMDCLAMGCTCRLHPGKMKGGVCCCVNNRALLKKFPQLASDPKFWKSLGLDPPRPVGTCQLQPDGCDLPGGHGMGPVPQQAHYPVKACVPFALFESPRTSLPAFLGLSKDPEAPVPGPD
jgi:hypothetical protein